MEYIKLYLSQQGSTTLLPIYIFLIEQGDIKRMPRGLSLLTIICLHDGESHKGDVSLIVLLILLNIGTADTCISIFFRNYQMKS